MRLSTESVVVITGAAGGIGRALADECARRGCRLALLDVDGEGLEEAQSELASGNREVTTHLTDVADVDQVNTARDAILRHHGTVDALINNAGVAVASPLEALDLDDFHWLMGANFWGAVHTCKAFVPSLLARPAAMIVNVLSDFALVGFPTKTAYSASKFALRGFSEALRIELLGTGVTVTCAYLGPVKTNLVRKSRTWNAQSRDAEAKFLEKRGMRPELVARRIVVGAERARPRVLIGKHTYLVDFLARAFPAATGSLIGRIRRRIPFLRDVT